MSKVIAIDTEFERYNTYRPVLSLVQVKEDNGITTIYDVIDKTANNQQKISYLKNLLSDDGIVKIIHSLRQDMEAIYCYFGITMKNMFDTQIAYKILHNENEIGYAKLVEAYCNIEIEKEKQLQKSHWLKRPLTPEQLFYAKQDVFYLHEIYEKMLNEFSTKPKLYQQFIDTCRYYENDELYKFNPSAVWQKTKHKLQKTDNYELIRKLFFLREKIANSVNLPREFVLKFTNLVVFAETKDIKFLKTHRKVNKNVFIKCLNNDK